MGHPLLAGRDTLSKIQLNTVKDGECLRWTAGHNRNGYGRIWVDGRNRVVHRVAYELLVGPIPDSLVLDHLCRVRDCVNVEHLEPVTNRENVTRGVGPEAMRNGDTCRNGCHPWPESAAVGRDGWLECTECTAERRSRHNARRAAARHHQRPDAHDPHSGSTGSEFGAQEGDSA